MKRIYSVSQVNSYIRMIIDQDPMLHAIDIRGEVSNCKYHSSGHVYFSLKDSRSSIPCIMYRSYRDTGLKFRMENGQEVTATGYISVYEQGGRYQFYVRKIGAGGTGDLYIRYEKLKKELDQAGYFAEERKKTLPFYPKRVGIVTASTGAAIQDIVSIARRRNPYVQLLLYPARVQGEGAARTIADGIRYFDSHDVDVIIIGRGGGSIEDLWAFNEREVADAIYHARTPIISGTGHETDYTIADFCADLRAATPSAACELAIPRILDILQTVDYYRTSLDMKIEAKLSILRQKQEQAGKLLAARHPGSRIIKQKMELAERRTALTMLMNQMMTAKKHRLEILTEKLTASSPSARLKGGYVFAHDGQGHPVRSVKEIRKGTPFGLVFADGEASVIPVVISETHVLSGGNGDEL